MIDKKETIDGKFVIALSRALRFVHKDSVDLFRENNITMAQFTVLEALYHKGELSVNALITAVLSTSGNMTVVIRNLEKRELIARVENPFDRRSYFVHLTENGKNLIAALFTEHMILLKKNLSVLSEQEKRNSIQIMKKLQ